MAFQLKCFNSVHRVILCHSHDSEIFQNISELLKLPGSALFGVSSSDFFSSFAAGGAAGATGATAAGAAGAEGFGGAFGGSDFLASSVRAPAAEAMASERHKNGPVCDVRGDFKN